ncbi:hypothetical protein G7Y79_00002g008340 [Physcia stellaris]|nr:hypothetical protein G7Y79_00002g008340 [Physcia stellaris]
MAPIKPTTSKKATSRRNSSSSKTPLVSTRRESDKGRGLLGITSKKDKRTIKHSALVSRIEKSKATPKKRRRPSKKLVTNLESLAAALPDAPGSKREGTVIGDGKIRQKSLKSRPGAMKRKEKLASLEKDRFNKNMAQMMAPRNMSQDDQFASGGDEAKSGSRNKWAALRGFIQQTMEQRPETETRRD